MQHGKRVRGTGLARSVKATRSNRWRRAAATLSELPADVLLDLPRITMLGTQEVHIENHHGLLHCARDRVRLRTSEGEVEVSGRRLRLALLLPEEVWIEGMIESVAMLSRPGGEGSGR